MQSGAFCIIRATTFQKWLQLDPLYSRFSWFSFLCANNAPHYSLIIWVQLWRVGLTSGRNSLSKHLAVPIPRYIIIIFFAKSRKTSYLIGPYYAGPFLRRPFFNAGRLGSALKGPQQLKSQNIKYYHFVIVKPFNVFSYFLAIFSIQNLQESS